MNVDLSEFIGNCYAKKVAKVVIQTKKKRKESR